MDNQQRILEVLAEVLVRVEQLDNLVLEQKVELKETLKQIVKQQHVTGTHHQILSEHVQLIKRQIDMMKTLGQSQQVHADVIKCHHHRISSLEEKLDDLRNLVVKHLLKEEQ